MSESSTPRRDFIGQMAVTALALAGTACATPAAVAQTAASPTTSGGGTGKWDDSWTGRLTAKHKAVFDSPDVAENSTLGLAHAQRYLTGMQDALGAGAGQAQAVIVIRHKSIPFAFNDAMWEKYKIGEEIKVKSGNDWATKNPGLSSRRGNDSADRPQATLTWFATHGHILLGCDLATQGYAQTIAQRTNGTMSAIYEELKANLVPGMILQPNGIYATLRAQEAGCAYIRST